MKAHSRNMLQVKSERSKRGARAYATGIEAEGAAARLLERCGATILARRWRSPYGELDLIALEGSTLVIVEVKARKTARDAAESISASQWSRLRAASEYLLSVYHTATEFAQVASQIPAPDLRLDVVTVDAQGFTERIPNARLFDEF